MNDKDKTITMEVITFIKYKDECYEIGEVIKLLLNKLDEYNEERKEVKEYVNTDKNCIPKHIKDYINNLLDKVSDKHE